MSDENELDSYVNGAEDMAKKIYDQVWDKIKELKQKLDLFVETEDYSVDIGRIYKRIEVLEKKDRNREFELDRLEHGWNEEISELRTKMGDTFISEKAYMIEQITELEDEQKRNSNIIDATVIKQLKIKEILREFLKFWRNLCEDQNFDNTWYRGASDEFDKILKKLSGEKLEICNHESHYIDTKSSCDKCDDIPLSDLWNIKPSDEKSELPKLDVPEEYQPFEDVSVDIREEKYYKSKGEKAVELSKAIAASGVMAGKVSDSKPEREKIYGPGDFDYGRWKPESKEENFMRKIFAALPHTEKMTHITTCPKCRARVEIVCSEYRINPIEVEKDYMWPITVEKEDLKLWIRLMNQVIINYVDTITNFDEFIKSVNQMEKYLSDKEEHDA